MNNCNIKDIKKISMNFRGLASRFLKSDPDDGILNLKKFLHYINNESVIKSFIDSKNVCIYDVENDIKRLQDSQKEYMIPEKKDDEINYIYQLLSCIAGKYEFYYYPISYAYGYEIPEQVDNFNHRVVLPFINYITTYLDEILIDLEDVERNAYIINANGSQINIAEKNSNIDATQNITNQKNDIEVILQTLVSEVKKLKIQDEQKEVILDFIDAAKDEIVKDHPKKSIIKVAIEKINEITEFGSNSITLLNAVHEAVKYFGGFIC